MITAKKGPVIVQKKQASEANENIDLAAAGGPTDLNNFKGYHKNNDKTK